MPMGPDARYSGPGAYQYNRPWSGNEERLVTQALAVADIPGAELQQEVRPPLPQIQLFPKKTGYGDPASRTLGIQDVINVDDRYTVYDFTGRSSGFGGTSRPSLGGS